MAGTETEVIVLRSVPYREADLILTLLTREHGRISALARSARASKRRFGGALGLFTLSRAELRPRRTGDLWTLSRASPVRLWPELAAEVAAVAHAGYGTELVRELAAPEQPDEGVFELLIELYDTVAANGPLPAVLRAFELRLLELIGLAPVLDVCVGCGTVEPERLDAAGAVLDPERGGVVCAECAPTARGGGVRMLSAPGRRYLSAAQKAPSLAGAAELDVAATDAREARDALLSMVLGHVGKPLRSLEFIAKLAGRRASDPEP